MKSRYEPLGKFIRQVDERNTNLEEHNLLGVSVQKHFIPSIANTVGTDFSKYKLVRKGQFTYIPDTSRRGDKIGIAFLDDYENGLVSNIYTVFEICDTEKLIPEYLMLWFMRPEFDRYARYKSHGSVREIFDWEEMCNVMLPVPPIERQRKIVTAYKTITDRIALKQRINDNLEAMLSTIFNSMFVDNTKSEVACLSDYITFGNGKERPKATGKIPVYGGNGILSYTDTCNANNVVLIGRVGAYCGSVYLETNDCWVSDNAIYAKSKISDKEYFDYFLLKNLRLYESHIGTGQQLLTQSILNKMTINPPNYDNITKFNGKAEKIFQTINHNKAEIEKLGSLSRLFLSKLSC